MLVPSDAACSSGASANKPAGPGQQVLVAGGGGGSLEGGHAPAELVGCVGDMDVQVGVDPMVSWGAVGCGMLVMAVSSAWRGGMARAPAGRTALRWVWATGSYQVTLVRLACRWWCGSSRQVRFKAPSRWMSGSGSPRNTTRSTVVATARADRSHQWAQGRCP